MNYGPRPPQRARVAALATLLTLSALAAGGTAFGQQSTDVATRERVARLDARLLELEQQVATLRETVERMDEQAARAAMAKQPWYKTVDPDWHRRYWNRGDFDSGQ